MLSTIIISVVMILFVLFVAQLRFTTVKTGTEKYRVQGQTYIETLDDNTPRNWFWKFFGVYYLGWAIRGYSTMYFEINTDKENPDPVVKTVDEFILKGGMKKIDFLLKEIPRAIIIKDAELGGAEPVQVNVGISLIFTLINGRTFGFTYRADFSPALTIIQSKVNDVIKTFTSYSEFINAGDKVLDHLLKDKKLQRDLRIFGLKLAKIKMPFRSTDKSIEEAARLKTIAELTQDAKKVEADNIRIEGQAKADVKKMETQAPIEGLKDSLKGLNKEELEAITEIQKSANIGGADSKIQTWVEKGNSTTTAITTK